jgi:fructokinase
LSSIARLYSGVPARWGRYAYSRSLKTRLVRNLHGDAGGVRGAAWLWSAGVEGATLAR